MRPPVVKTLRFAAAGMLAVVVVTGLMVGVLWGFGLLDRPGEIIYAQPVEILSSSSRLDVADLLDKPDKRKLPELPPVAEIPPMEIPHRPTSGFVQVEFEIDEQGKVKDAQVVNALPAGVYEDQALAEVKSRRWAADPRGGKLTEVVRFEVPEAGTAEPPTDKPAGQPEPDSRPDEP